MRVFQMTEAELSDLARWRQLLERLDPYELLLLPAHPGWMTFSPEFRMEAEQAVDALLKTG